VYQFGDLIKRTELANTLEKIANSPNPVELFYHGEMADLIVKEIQASVKQRSKSLKYRF
jgi:gamma-glutamyltranspeptidase